MMFLNALHVCALGLEVLAGVRCGGLGGGLPSHPGNGGLFEPLV